MQNPVEDPPQDMPGWAQRIKRAREQANMTQRELGDRIGRSQQAVDGYESGGRKPNVALYEHIARVCDVDPRWLIFGDNSPGGRPNSDQSMLEIVAEAEKQSRHFAWAFKQAADFLTEEGIEADFPYLLAYTQKLLRMAERETNDTRIKQIILDTIERNRNEFRDNLKRARHQLL